MDEEWRGSDAGLGQLACSTGGGAGVATGAANATLTSTRGLVSIDVCGGTTLVTTPLRVFVGEVRVTRRGVSVHLCLLICRKYFRQLGQNCR